MENAHEIISLLILASLRDALLARMIPGVSLALDPGYFL